MKKFVAQEKKKKNGDLKREVHEWKNKCRDVEAGRSTLVDETVKEIERDVTEFKEKLILLEAENKDLECEVNLPKPEEDCKRMEGVSAKPENYTDDALPKKTADSLSTLELRGK